MQSLVLLCLLGQEFDPHGEAPAVGPRRFEAAADEQFARPPMREQSLLSFFWMALGPFYTLALLGSGLLLFVGAVLVVLLGRPPVIAAYLALVPIPFLIGLYGVFDGMIASFRILATSSEAPRPSEVAVGISTSLVTGLLGTGAIIPSLFVLGLGLLIKTASASAAAVPEIYPPPYRA
jgi:hypothetical protein